MICTNDCQSFHQTSLWQRCRFVFSCLRNRRRFMSLAARGMPVGLRQVLRKRFPSARVDAYTFVGLDLFNARFFRIPCCQWPRRPTSTWSPLFLQSCLRATRPEHRVSFRASFFHGVIGMSGDRSIAIVPTPSTRLQRVMRARISVHEDQFPPGSPRSESVGIISGSRGGCRPWAF